MKRILYLTFYFEPDLCAGSFRNSPLVKELAYQAKGRAAIDVLTTLPNRYRSFSAEAPAFEQRDNYDVTRIAIPQHESGMKDQIRSFREYYSQVKKRIKGKRYDLVVASSSRLFTAFLGYTIAKRQGIPLYLDIRDIFYDTLEDVLDDGPVKSLALPVIKQVEKRTFRYARHINLISGGFKPYFRAYDHAAYTYYPNGIDDVFLDVIRDEAVLARPVPSADQVKTIVYAGNIGEGQGLHKVIPEAAKKLGDGYQFVVIGDGGARKKLVEELEDEGVTNVELRPPVSRSELIDIYKRADFLFAHLNDHDAFEKVLPSKLFELATFPQPLIAGVGGFAGEFVKTNIKNSILFEPCNAEQLVRRLKKYSYQSFIREEFVERFKRDTVNKEMAASILQYI